MEGTITNSSEFYMNDDVVYEILSWMPAKSIVRHSSFLSKTLLCEPQFIHKQTLNSSFSDGGFFVQTNMCTNLDLYVLPNESPTSFGIPKESLTFLQTKVQQVLTSTQGLVLFHEKVEDDHRFSIINPVTKTMATIPYPKNIENLVRFGDEGFMIACDPRNPNFPDDYTVIAPLFVETKDNRWNYGFRLAVYRDGEWDHDTCELGLKTCFDLRLSSTVAVFSGPNKGLMVHCLADSLPNAMRNPVYLESYMAVYDMEKKVLWKNLKLPEGAWEEFGYHNWVDLFKWGKDEKVGVARIDGKRIKVWVLEKYDPVSWRKVVDETVGGMGVPEEEGRVLGCSVVNGVGLLFATWNLIYWYEMEGVNAGRLVVVGEHGVDDPPRFIEFTMYANTFRPVFGEEINLIS